jgi:hypothetical protein
MAFEARLVKGDPHLAAYIAGADYAAGEVISFGGLAAVVHPVAIATGATGNIAIFGGEWELAKDGSSGPAVVVGESVAWIVSTNLASDVTTGNLPFGQCTVAGDASTAAITAFLDPARVAANTTT